MPHKNQNDQGTPTLTYCEIFEVIDVVIWMLETVILSSGGSFPALPRITEPSKNDKEPSTCLDLVTTVQTKHVAESTLESDGKWWPKNLRETRTIIATNNKQR